MLGVGLVQADPHQLGPEALATVGVCHEDLVKAVEPDHLAAGESVIKC